MEMTEKEAIEVKRIYDLFYAMAISAEEALEDLELVINGDD